MCESDSPTWQVGMRVLVAECGRANTYMTPSVFVQLDRHSITGAPYTISLKSQARFPFERNRLRCVRCVNENRKKRNFHAKNEIFTQQTQAPANRNVRSKQWQPWLAACQRKRLRFLRFSFTQRTQRKRLRLNGNRASLRIHCLTVTLNQYVCPSIAIVKQMHKRSEVNNEYSWT